MIPTDIKKTHENKLGIIWDDGHESAFSMLMLRKRCPCATCKNAKESVSQDPLRVLSPNEVISDNIQIREAEIVGRYAVQFTWSDGHREGIYSFDYLLELCECKKCKAAGKTPDPTPAIAE